MLLRACVFLSAGANAAVLFPRSRLLPLFRRRDFRQVPLVINESRSMSSLSKDGFRRDYLLEIRKISFQNRYPHLTLCLFLSIFINRSLKIGGSSDQIVTRIIGN